LESHDEKDASELVLASLKLTDRLVSIVDAHHLQVPADSLPNQRPVSASLQGTAYSSETLKCHVCILSVSK